MVVRVVRERVPAFDPDPERLCAIGVSLELSRVDEAVRRRHSMLLEHGDGRARVVGVLETRADCAVDGQVVKSQRNFELWGRRHSGHRYGEQRRP
jgi:hypothetical protein